MAGIVRQTPCDEIDDATHAKEIWPMFQDPAFLRCGSCIYHAIQYTVEYSHDVPHKLRWLCACSNSVPIGVLFVLGSRAPPPQVSAS